ncbi:pectate lyase [Fusarium acutatum]|uniref:Probable pectate lyase F n=1 Tax=Fusarium acutatum TaxID=78861 RepID=A0A8H4K2F8_9HYPO|nr:pectate lyase [Fusarium acutatum]
MLILEDGATLRNVIIGPGQAEGVHCKGTCTLENVWFEGVCEDAITLKQKSGTSTIRGGCAFHAAGKVVQFNGRGTVEISNFYVEDYGKLVRSCGNCKDNGGPQIVVIDNIAAVNGGVLCGNDVARQVFQASDHVSLPFEEKHSVTFRPAYVDNCCPGYEFAEADVNRVEALLLQVATLRTYSLQSQVHTHTGIKDWLFETQDRDLPHMICTATQQELKISSGSKEQQVHGLFDFVDERIYFHALKSITDDPRTPTYSPNIANAGQGIVKRLTATQLPIKASESSSCLPFSINTEGLSDGLKLISTINFCSLNKQAPTWAGDLAHGLMHEYRLNQMSGNEMFSIQPMPLKLYYLLLAPCPIIALSATVGHLHELKDRLTISQAQKAYDMDTIVHEVSIQIFSVSVPWLDQDDSISPNFRLAHPVLALKDRNISL